MPGEREIQHLEKVFEQRLAGLERLYDDRLAALKKVLKQQIIALERLYDARLAAQREALEIQAAEYSRRLEQLNHRTAEHERSRTLYLSIERYESDIRLNKILWMSVLMALATSLFAIIRA